MVKTKELYDSNIFTTSEKITLAGLKNSSAKKLPINTIVIAMYGATVGKLGIIKNEMCTNQACCCLVPDENNVNYLYLFYAILNYRNELINMASGAAQQNINQEIIKNFKIPYYSKEIQDKIAKILSFIDEKIELNKNINKNLGNCQLVRDIFIFFCLLFVFIFISLYGDCYLK